MNEDASIPIKIYLQKKAEGWIWLTDQLIYWRLGQSVS